MYNNIYNKLAIQCAPIRSIRSRGQEAGVGSSRVDEGQDKGLIRSYFYKLPVLLTYATLSSTLIE